MSTKSKNQEKNELKRLAKLQKFEAKMQKQQEAKVEKQQEAKVEKQQESMVEKIVQNIVPEIITPKGQKKILGDFATSYKPRNVESAWYDWWERCGYFKPNTNSATYVIPIPPPNVTGALHIGHALTNSIQDCLVRFHRMKGKSTLWVPGCDHAGIATQVVVEKKLFKEKKITRHEMGRENFIKEVHLWKDDYILKIYNQLRRLGGPFDWDRAKFTLDPDLCKAVNEAFVRLHDDGTIYRANRLVNWCTKLKTALSNLEVENVELQGRKMMSVPDHDPEKLYEFGVLISFAYQIENSDERIVVATTRLETMLGDTAIAVHPSDKRYTHLHGKFAIHPFVNRRVPIVADEYPDPEFGTGAVKITPAHDFNDFIVGKRQNLDFINIMTDDGKMNENCGIFEGMQRFDARVAVLAALKEKNLYVETQDNKMMLPICTRSGNIVEPLIKPQWWVSCGPMAEQALNAVKTGDMKISPPASEKEWFRWLENIQDWCISRQLWWGHRVPAYFVNIKGDQNDKTIDSRWVSGRDIEEAKDRAYKLFPNVEKSSITLEQDEDVLDTWFSAGLWPFSIMGWPEKTADMEAFFPNSLLETGWDILFFWVARMAMMSLKLTGQVPFKQVFCHAMVRDAHGRKMSKSLGNVIDPLDVIHGITLKELNQKLESGNLDPREVERAKLVQKQDFPNGIPECGTDALRFTLLAYTSTGRDINLDILRVDGYSKFCNKLWNAVRFAHMKLGIDYQPRDEDTPTGTETLAGKWILHKLTKTIIETTRYLEDMNFMQATQAVHQFWLYDLCDVYLEVCKPVFDGQDQEAILAAQDVLYICLDQGLKLLHPFMPFVTEELYQRLNRRPSDKVPSIMISKFPEHKTEWYSEQAERDFEYINSVVRASRGLMTDYNLKKNAKIYLESNEEKDLLQKHNLVIKGLIRCTELCVVDTAPPGCAVSTLAGTNVYLLVKGYVDIDSEISKLQSKKDKIQTLYQTLHQKTAVDGYKNVPNEVKQKDQEKLALYNQEMETFEKSIIQFKKLALQ